MLDLVLPLECGGCGAPSTRWCDVCAGELAAGADQPRVIAPRVDCGVPVFALGRYAGVRREAIVAVKEKGRVDLVVPLARALAVGLQRLLGWGLLDLPLVIVPAPTRRSAARRRGGDPVTRIVELAAAGDPGIAVVPALRMSGLARDSVGLSGAARERNVAGRVVVRRHRLPSGAEILVVDDIVTTGATAAESVRMLRAHGAKAVGVLAIAAA